MAPTLRRPSIQGQIVVLRESPRTQYPTAEHIIICLVDVPCRVLTVLYIQRTYVPRAKQTKYPKICVKLPREEVSYPRSDGHTSS